MLSVSCLILRVELVFVYVTGEILMKCNALFEISDTKNPDTSSCTIFKLNQIGHFEGINFEFVAPIWALWKIGWDIRNHWLKAPISILFYEVILGFLPERGNIKFGDEKKFEEIFWIGDPENPCFSIMLSFLREIILVPEKVEMSNPRPSRGRIINLMKFGISHPEKPICVFGSIPSKILKLVVQPSFSSRADKILYPKRN